MYSLDVVHIQDIVISNGGRILNIPHNINHPFKVECKDKHIFDIFYTEITENRWCEKCYLNNYYCPGNKIVIMENILREKHIRCVKNKFCGIYKYDLYFEDDDIQYFVLHRKNEDSNKNTIAKIKNVIDTGAKIIVIDSEILDGENTDIFVNNFLSMKDGNIYFSGKSLYSKIFDSDYNIGCFPLTIGVYLNISVNTLSSIIDGGERENPIYYPRYSFGESKNYPPPRNSFCMTSSQRSKPPFGYKFVSKDDPFAEDPEEMAALEKIRQIISLEPHLNITQICKKLNELGVKCRKAKMWYPSTLKNVMNYHKLLK